MRGHLTSREVSGTRRGSGHFAYTARVTSRLSPDRAVVGTLLIILGVAALVEARRLHALREAMVAGAVVGDDTFPLIVGVAMVVLGGLCLVVRITSGRSRRGPARRRSGPPKNGAVCGRC